MMKCGLILTDRPEGNLFCDNEATTWVTMGDPMPFPACQPCADLVVLTGAGEHGGMN